MCMSLPSLHGLYGSYHIVYTIAAGSQPMFHMYDIKCHLQCCMLLKRIEQTKIMMQDFLMTSHILQTLLRSSAAAPVPKPEGQQLYVGRDRAPSFAPHHSALAEIRAAAASHNAHADIRAATNSNMALESARYTTSREGFLQVPSSAHPQPSSWHAPVQRQHMQTVDARDCPRTGYLVLECDTSGF